MWKRALRITKNLYVCCGLTLSYLQIAGKPHDNYRISLQSVNIAGFPHNRETLQRPVMPCKHLQCSINIALSCQDEKVHCVKTKGFPTETEIAGKHFWYIDRFFFHMPQLQQCISRKKKEKQFAVSGLCNMSSKCFIGTCVLRSNVMWKLWFMFPPQLFVQFLTVSFFL